MSELGKNFFIEEVQDFNENIADPKTETVIALIKENNNAFNSKKSNKALSNADMRVIIQQEVKNKKKQKELLKWVEYYETISLFLTEIAGGDAHKAYLLLKKNPYLATIKDFATGNTPLAIVIKNYSFVSKDEENLLKKIIELAPYTVAFNNNNSTIWRDIQTFEGHKEKYDEQIKRIVRSALKKVKIKNDLKKQFLDALNNKNYDVVITMFQENPQLAYFHENNFSKKTLLDYINEAYGKLDPIKLITKELLA